MAILDDISGIFTGGLQEALDIEAEKARKEIELMSPAQDHEGAAKGDSGTLYRQGTAQESPGGVPAMFLYGGALIAVAVIVLLLRR